SPPSRRCVNPRASPALARKSSTRSPVTIRSLQPLALQIPGSRSSSVRSAEAQLPQEDSDGSTTRQASPQHRGSTRKTALGLEGPRAPWDRHRGEGRQHPLLPRNGLQGTSPRSRRRSGSRRKSVEVKEILS